LVASYDLRPVNGAGLCSKEKISKGVDKKRKKGRKKDKWEANDVNKQMMYAEINERLKGALLPGAHTGLYNTQ